MGALPARPRAGCARGSRLRRVGLTSPRQSYSVAKLAFVRQLRRLYVGHSIPFHEQHRAGRGLRLPSVVVLALTMGAAFGCGSGDDDSAADGSDAFVLGASVAQTGDYAPYGEPILEGIRLAVDQINQDGGINGSPVELLVRDNQTDAALSAQTTQELIDEGAQGLIVACENSRAIAAGTLAQEAEVPAISSCSTGPKVPDAVGNYMFLALFGDNAQAAAMAEEACDRGYESAYLLRSSDLEFLDTTPLYFADAFEHLCGGQITGEGFFKPGAQDFSAQIARIRDVASDTDAIYTAMFVPDSPVFVKQLRAAGLDTAYLGADGNDDPSFPVAAGSDAADGVTFTTHAFAQPGSVFQEVLDTFDAENPGKKPANESGLAQGWDEAMLFADAVERAGSTDPAEIRNALEATQGFEGATGEISYSPDSHVPEKTICRAQWQNGEKELIRCKVPEYVPAP